MIPLCRCGRRRVRDHTGVLQETCGTCRERDVKRARDRERIARVRAKLRDSRRRS